MKGLRNCYASSFHIKLLSKIIDIDQYPFTKLMIENNITESEYEELMQFLDDLNENYHLQKEEGLINFSSLLIQFAGMLNEKLDPDETIAALKKEGYYPSLLVEFTKIILKESRYR